MSWISRSAPASCRSASARRAPYVEPSVTRTSEPRTAEIIVSKSSGTVRWMPVCDSSRARNLRPTSLVHSTTRMSARDQPVKRRNEFVQVRDHMMAARREQLARLSRRHLAFRRGADREADHQWLLVRSAVARAEEPVDRGLERSRAHGLKADDRLDGRLGRAFEDNVAHGR